MARHLIHRAIATIGIIAVIGTLSEAPAFAGGGPPKVSLSETGCVFDAVVAWNKQAVAEINWSFNLNGVTVAGGFTSGIGTLTSPQSTGWTRPTGTTSNKFTVTAQLLSNGSSLPVATATSKTLKADCD